jgi:hypothetical protein
MVIRFFTTFIIVTHLDLSKPPAAKLCGMI